MKTRLHTCIFVAAASCAAFSNFATAEILASADFSGYADGALVGQNGWVQYNTSATSPIQVSSGKVAWTGGVTVDNQDAVLLFPSQIPQPASGSTVLHFDMVLSVFTAGANPSYFAALNTLNTTSTASNFQNARIVAKAGTTGFLFGARVNGQNGYPFAYGTTELTYGTTYALRAEINMVSGNANDFINLYVGPNFSSLALYATASYNTGTVADPLFGGLLLSQFGSATVNQSGVSFNSVSVTMVPEPATVASLLGLGALAVVAFRRIRRKA